MRHSIAAAICICLLGCRVAGGGEAPDAGLPDATPDAAWPDASAVDPEAQLQVLTWNLETFPMTDETVERVRDIIADLAPDLVAMQEVVSEGAFIQLAGSLPGYRGHLAADNALSLKVGFLYREATVQVRDVRLLFTGDRFVFPRPALHAEMRFAGVDFRFVVVHLKALEDAESRERRREAIEQLELWITGNERTTQEDDYLVAGDFNDKLLDPPTQNVFGPFLDQADRYSFATALAEQQGQHTNLPFRSFIDHVLTTRAFLDELPLIDAHVLPLEQTEAGYERVISDHRPVLATFGVPQP